MQPVPVRVLGPVSLSRDDDVHRVSGPRPRGILALLATTPERVVPVDLLVEQLWGAEPPPASAAKALTVHVSRLRRSLADAGGSARVEHRGNGYVLTGPEPLVDAVLAARHRRLARAGTPHSVVAVCDEALALWTGPPYADVDLTALHGERQRLADLHLDLRELRAVARSALAPPDGELADELAALVAAAPLRERPTELLLLALYRQGRKADALRAYEHHRRHLAEETGLTPGPSLQRLEAAVLQDDDLRWTPTATDAVRVRSVTPPAGPFVGRERELAIVLDRCRAAPGPGVAVVEGDPGIGKSRLLAEVTARLREDGVAVVSGRCDSSGALPYRPFLDVLRGLGPRDRRTSTTWEALGGGPHERVRPWDDRVELFTRIADALEAAAHGSAGGMVLALDDLQWIDEVSAALLRFLVGGEPPLPLGYLVAARSGPAGPVWASLRRSLVARAEPVGLDALGRNDVEDLITGCSGAASAERRHLAVSVHERTGGNAFLVTELLDQLDASGATELAAPPGVAGGPPPDAVAAMVSERLGPLSDGARRIVEYAAVAGGAPGLPVVLAAAGLDRHEGYAVAAEALTSGLLVDAAGPDRVQFRHELVRDAVLAGLRSPERRHRHVGLARATAGRVAAGEAARAELVSAARHYLDGFPACPASEVEEAAVAAAQAAVDLLALEDAAEFAVRALGLRPSGPDPACAAELLLVAGIAAGQLARNDEARTLLDRALEVARGLGDAHLIARVALGGEPPARPLLDYLARLPRLQVSLDALEGHQCLDRVRVGTALVREGSVPGRYHDRRGLAEEAVAQARVLGDPRALYGALTGWLEQHQGLQVTGRLAVADELVDLAPRTGDAALAVRARLTRAHERLRSGDGRGMEADVKQLRAAVRGTRRVRDRWMLAVVETTLSRLHGDLGAAARHAGEALGHVTGVGEFDAGLCHAVHLFFEAFHLGRLAGLVKLATETHRAGPDLPSLSLAAALAGAEAGQPVRPHVIDSALDGSAADELWPATVALATMLADATGDIRRLPDLRGALEPLTGTIIVTGALSGCFGPADRYLAMVSRRSGDHEAGRGHAERAVHLAEAAGTVVWTLWSRVELAAATVDADPRSAVRTAAAIEAEARRLVLPGPARAAARLCIRAGKQVG